MTGALLLPPYPRVYAPEAGQAPALGITLSPEESHHLVKVRRVASGANVTVLDGRGGLGTATIREAKASGARLELSDWQSIPPESPHITLQLAIPKGKTMDNVVQKAVEMGVHRLEPWQTAHSEVNLQAERAEKKQEKWQAIAIEALKQSGHLFLTTIAPTATLPKHFAPPAEGELRVVAALQGQPRPASAIWRERGGSPTRLTLAIGPEGDFSREEYAHLFGTGQYQALNLGPRILRVETAVVAALARLQEATALAY